MSTYRLRARRGVAIRLYLVLLLGAIALWVTLYLQLRLSEPKTADAVVPAPAALDTLTVAPLRMAHVSGGAAWSAERKQGYYRNDRAGPGALQVIAGRTNRQKRDSGPENWQPPRRSSRCQYAQTWVEVKVQYELTVTRKERKALADMLATC